MPCSTPTRATVSNVITVSPSSNRSKRAMATSSRRWKIRVATKISTPARVAKGTSFNKLAAGTSSASAVAVPRQAAWVRPPAEATMAVRGGLAFTGKEPQRPARMLPAPTPRKSRPTSTAYPPWSAKARVVAADWLRTTSATTAAIGATLPNVDQDRPTSPKRGAPCAKLPSTATPWV